MTNTEAMNKLLRIQRILIDQREWDACNLIQKKFMEFVAEHHAAMKSKKRAA